MKTAALTLALLIPLGLLQAEPILQNSDFLDGMAHWYGDCRTTADMAADSDDPAIQASTPKPGLVVKLRSGSWTKVQQDFATPPGTLNLAITYTVSPDLKFSTSPDDYTNMTGAVGFTAWRAYPTQIAHWCVLMCDVAAGHANISQFLPQITPDPQTVQGTFSRLKSNEQKTICLAFPPGQGTVTFQNISLTPVVDTP